MPHEFYQFRSAKLLIHVLPGFFAGLYLPQNSRNQPKIRR
jgi:hypothetical protein